MPEQLTPEAAHQLLIKEVYTPVFLEKLANDFGIVPQNEDEVVLLLKIAGDLAIAEEQNNIKTAQQKSGLIAAAANNLGTAMSKMGFANPQEAQAAAQEEALIKAASANLAATPKFQEAFTKYYEGVNANVKA
jgi:hypothetical protein